jgi:hypothetical protein
MKNPPTIRSPNPLGMILYSACWKSSDSFGRDDLLVLAQLLGATYTFILQKQAEN